MRNAAWWWRIVPSLIDRIPWPWKVSWKFFLSNFPFFRIGKNADDAMLYMSTYFVISLVLNIIINL